MGYSISQMEANFHIKKENFEKCLEVIKALDPEKYGGSGSSYSANFTKKHFSWVTTDEYKNAKTLQEALRAWGWYPEFEEAEEIGDIVYICFERERLGDDEILFNTIAPFVEKDSYIQMQGEEGCLWRWQFDGKMCYENNPEIKWE